MKNLLAVLALCIVSLGQATVLPKTTIFNKTTSFAPPPITLPAYVKGCHGSNSPTASITCGFTGNVTNGDIIACPVLKWDTSLVFSSLSKTSGTSTVGAFSGWDTGGAFTTVSSGANRFTMGYALVTGTGTATITLAVTGGTGNLSIICVDISGGATSTPLDAATLVVQSAPGTGTNGVTTGNIPTTVTNEFVLAGTWDVFGNASSVAAGTSGSGYTLDTTDQVSTTIIAESQVWSGSGTIPGTYTATGGGADDWFVGVMAFKHL